MLRRRLRWIRAATWIACGAVVLWAVGVIADVIDKPGPLAVLVHPAVILIGGTLPFLLGLIESRMSRRLRRRVAALQGAVCAECGYDLTGAGKTEVCPECGEAFTLEELRRRWEDWYGRLD